MITELTKLNHKAIRNIRGNKIAMIFQEPMTSLNPVFTCGYQVMESLLKHKDLTRKEAKKAALELFRQVELPDPSSILKRYPHQLSGGQKQRVMIAMAISCKPDVLIADEPTTALDVRVQANILQLLKKLQKETGLAILLITHDLGLVSDVADDIIVMNKGKVVEQGIARNVLHDPVHPYTKALLACRPAANAKGKRLPVIADFSETETPIAAPDNKPPLQGNEVLLSVRNLTVRFPFSSNIFGTAKSHIKAVDNVSFDVKKNEILGLVGESGSGKTTLGRAVLQLIKPSSGEILLHGKNISHLKPAELRAARKDLQIVFQDPYGSLNPRLTIGDAILEPLKVHRMHNNHTERKEKVLDLLEKVKLEPSHYSRYPHQFSGGQRQRICIARALALEPSFLVFDESVSALDVSVQAQVLNLINDLRSTFNFTGIFISHDLSVVHYISNRIIVMKDGRINEEGSADQVYHHPQSDYTRLLIEAIPGRNV